jgi:predicted Zn-dependent protease
VNGLAIRCALVVVALLVGAYLAVGVHNVRLIDDGNAVLAKARTGKVPAKTVDAALSDYEDAQTLSPDPTPLIHQGELLLASGRKIEANKALIRAIQEEPDNIQAWTLAYAASAGDPAAHELAKHKLLKLNPWFLYVLTGQSPS